MLGNAIPRTRKDPAMPPLDLLTNYRHPTGTVDECHRCGWEFSK